MYSNHEMTTGAKTTEKTAISLDDVLLRENEFIHDNIAMPAPTASAMTNNAYDIPVIDISIFFQQESCAQLGPKGD